MRRYLVPVILRKTGATLLLTQRTAHLRDHAAVGFSRGALRSFGRIARSNSLREAEEEVRLSRRTNRDFGPAA